MKKLILLFTAIALAGCSDDSSSNSSSSTSFDFDGTEYQLQNGLNMNEIIMPQVTDFNGDSYDRSTLSITGLNGSSSTATVSFDLYYKTGTSIAGTYNIHDSEATNSVDFEDFLIGQNRGCMGWTSAGVAYSMNTGTFENGNNPTGTVKVIVNSPTNYTLIYNGNFRLYENGFDFVRNMPAEINVTSDVTIQN